MTSRLPTRVQVGTDSRAALNSEPLRRLTEEEKVRREVESEGREEDKVEIDLENLSENIEKFSKRRKINERGKKLKKRKN